MRTIDGDDLVKRILEISQEPHADPIYDNKLQASQIALLCGAIAMNDEFGFGMERQMRVSQRSEELSGRYAREGIKFLLDKMEEIGFSIENGQAVAYVGEDGEPVRPKRRKKKET